MTSRLMAAEAASICCTSAVLPNQATYRDAAKMTSRLMAAEAASICCTSAVLPMTLPASRNSRQVSSRRTMARTMDPSSTSVSSQMSLKGIPLAQW